MLFVQPKEVAAKNRKIISSMIFAVLALGLAAYGVTYFISQQREKARLEAEKKEFAAFDMINFKTDADSVANAMKSLPPQFNQQPPYTDLIKRNVSEFESVQKKSERTAQPTLSSTVRFKNGSAQVPGYSVTGNTITTYSVIELQPLQFDYVKGAGNKLVCFVTYQARLGVFQRAADLNKDFQHPALKQQAPYVSKDPGKKVGEREVRETARYDFENGSWVFKDAGISDINRLKEIDQVRIEAKTKM
jgi:hypothetical protein